MIFSHGLGGNRNAYSHLAGSMASYGVVVICPEHRDGSAALTVVRDPKSQNHKSTRHVVPYVRIPHDQNHKTWEARNKQIRIRLWELGLIFDAVSALDRGDSSTIASNLNHSTPKTALAQFANALDILEPGRVLFSGHSFGAVTIVQLLKSTFYASHPSLSAMANPLFTPAPSSALARQITAHNPTVLLDMWCFPLHSASTAALYNLPLPCYSSPSAPGGAALLAVESAAFFKWTEHLHAKARILSPDPASLTGKGTQGVVTGSLFEHGGTGDGSGVASWEKPRFFYVASSAHLNQSDFGVLFPWLTRRVFKSDRPERVLRLNARAQLQFLRENGVVVEGTARGDLVEGGGDVVDDGKGREEWVEEDGVILEGERGKGKVEAWVWIDVVGLGAKAGPTELEMQRGEESRKEEAEEGEKEMQGEIEPSLEGVAEGAAAGAAREVVGN